MRSLALALSRLIGLMVRLADSAVRSVPTIPGGGGIHTATYPDMYASHRQSLMDRGEMGTTTTSKEEQ